MRFPNRRLLREVHSGLGPPVSVGRQSAWQGVEAQVSRSTASPAVLLGLVAVFFGVLFLRAPNILLHAGLWGEEGWVFYPDAYKAGLASLLWPDGGYLNTFSRLVALAVQAAPLLYVPAIFAATGLLIQAVTAAFIVSNRMAPAWPSTAARLLFALIYLVLPNSWEIYGNLTDAQWHLAILAFCIVVSVPPTNARQIIFDVAVLVVSGLSGPFCILLLPIAFWQAFVDRRAANWWRGVVLLVTACVQMRFLLVDHRAAGLLPPLGAKLILLLRIVALQIFSGSVLGLHGEKSLIHTSAWHNNALPILICFLGLVLIALAVVLGSPLLRKAILVAGLSFAAALITPLASATLPQWQAMAMPGVGERYYVFPIMAWLGALFVLAAARPWILRTIGLVLILTMVLWGVPSDWTHYPYPFGTDFAQRAEAFMAAPVGTKMAFPVRPGGARMILVKHGTK